MAPPGFFKRIFGARPAEDPQPGLRRCSGCGAVYAPGEVPDEEDERIEARRARMEERMAGFQPSQPLSGFGDEAYLRRPAGIPGVIPGKAPPAPVRSLSLDELARLGEGIELQKPQGIKCRKCGHFAFLVRTPESRCAACGRLYAKMDDDAVAGKPDSPGPQEKRD